MPTRLDDAQWFKDEAEKVHERMVEIAKDAREDERNIRFYEAALVTMSRNDPRRVEFEQSRDLFQRSLERNRRLMEMDRLLLDGSAVIIESIEDGA